MCASTACKPAYDCCCYGGLSELFTVKLCYLLYLSRPSGDLSRCRVLPPRSPPPPEESPATDHYAVLQSTASDASPPVPLTLRKWDSSVHTIHNLGGHKYALLGTGFQNVRLDQVCRECFDSSRLEGMLCTMTADAEFAGCCFCFTKQSVGNGEDQEQDAETTKDQLHEWGVCEGDRRLNANSTVEAHACEECHLSVWLVQLLLYFCGPPHLCSSSLPFQIHHTCELIQIRIIASLLYS